MKNSCSINIKLDNGEYSLLIPELRKISNGMILKQLYAISRDENFRDIYKNVLQFDKNGEPTIDTLLQTDPVKKFMKESNIKDFEIIQKQYGIVNSKGNTVFYPLTSLSDVLSKINSFNNSVFNKDYAMSFDMNSDNKLFLTLKSKVNNAQDVKKDENTRRTIEQVTLFNNNVTLTHPNKFFEEYIKALQNKNISLDNLGSNLISSLSRIVDNVNKKVNNVSVSKKLTDTDAILLKYLIISIPINNFINRLQTTVMQSENGLTAEDCLFHYLNNDTVEDPLYNNLLSGELLSGSTRMLNDYINTEVHNLNTMTDTLIKKPNEDGIDYDLFADYDTFFDGMSYSKKVQEVINKLKAIEHKRKEIGKTNRIKNVEKESENVISLLNEDDPSLGILLYMNNGITRLRKLEKIAADNNYDYASKLRYVKNLISSYELALNDVRDIVNELGNKQQIKDAIDTLTGLCADLNNVYVNEARKLASKVFADIMPEGMTINIKAFNPKTGKKEMTKFTKDQIIEYAPRDISVWDRFLDGLADSSDAYLNMYAKFVERQKNKIYEQQLRIEEQLQAAHIKAEKAGIKDFTFMYVRKPDGTIDREHYVGEYDWNLYNAAHKEELDRLHKKYGEKPLGKDLTNFYNEHRKWLKENIDQATSTPADKYISKQYENLTPAQREYYDTVMLIYQQHINKLPTNSQKLTDSIKITSSKWEKIKRSGSPSKAFEQWKQNKKENWVKMSDDTEFGEVSTLQDFQGRRVQKIPIYFTKLKPNENADNISDDITSNMIAFCNMAINYQFMNEIVDTCEVLTDNARFRDIQQTTSGKPLIETLQVGKQKITQPLIKKGETSQAISRLIDFNNQVVYDQKQKDEGTFLGFIDKGKVANNINKMTASTTYALNGLASITNVLTGVGNMLTESIANQYFGLKDTRHGDAFYFKHIIDYLGDVGSRTPTSLLGMIDKEFDIMQKGQERRNFINKTRLTQILGPKLAYLGNDVGEHFMQMRTYLALASKEKCLLDGKKVSLLDCFEVDYIDGEKKYGGRLKLKDGTKRLDGKEYTREDLDKIARKSKAINNQLHGIYNNFDINAIQQYGLGRMAIMFKKYLKPALNRRFQGKQYNFDLENYVEGYYTTAGRVIWDILKELRHGNFAIKSGVLDQLDAGDRANIKRAITEASLLAAVSIALRLIDWDDDEDDYGKNLLEVSLRRWQNEMGALVPNTMFPSANLKLTTNPAAGINWLENVSNLFNCMIHPIDNFFGDDAVLQSGLYKGYKKGTRAFLKVFPYWNPVVRTMQPESTIPYYK